MRLGVLCSSMCVRVCLGVRACTRTRRRTCVSVCVRVLICIHNVCACVCVCVRACGAVRACVRVLVVLQASTGRATPVFQVQQAPRICVEPTCSRQREVIRGSQLNVITARLMVGKQSAFCARRTPSVTYGRTRRDHAHTATTIDRRGDTLTTRPVDYEDYESEDYESTTPKKNNNLG